MARVTPTSPRRHSRTSREVGRLTREAQMETKNCRTKTCKRLVVLASLLSATGFALPQEGIAQNDAEDCAALAIQYQAEDVVITSAVEVPEVTTGASAAPAHCDVRGTIRGNIKF